MNMHRVALGGVIAAVMLLSGCDRPDHEPDTPKPNMSEGQEKVTYGGPSEQQQKLTYGGPTETRSQSEYSEQMEETLSEESLVYFTEAER
jgi:hypothetical protein